MDSHSLLFYVVALLSIIVLAKPLFFIVMAIPMKWKINRDYKKWMRIHCKENADASNDFAAPQKFSGTLLSIKDFVFSFIGASIRYFDIQTGKIPSFLIRNLMYKSFFGVSMGHRVTIHYGAEIRAHKKLVVGDGCIVGDKCLLDARNTLTLGKNVNISSNCSIYTAQHDHRDPWFRVKNNCNLGVKIDDRVWIGANVVVLPSVHIGEGAVVASGAVVTKDVAPYTMVAGIPARYICDRNRDLKYEFDGKNSGGN